MLRGLGLLFVMWNVPYVFACLEPVRHRTSLIEALLMQAIGFIGETLILLCGRYQDAVLTASVERFMLFDGAGLLLLAGALLLSRKMKE
jgi:hypothetical protein